MLESAVESVDMRHMGRKGRAAGRRHARRAGGDQAATAEGGGRGAMARDAGAAEGKVGIKVIIVS